MHHESPNRPTAAWRLALRALLLALLVSACAGELQTQGEALRLLNTDLPEAIINEPYRAQLHAVGGLRPYEYGIGGGSLPPGIELQGGELRGVPTAIGEFEIEIEVSDANLSKTYQEYRLQVVTPPEPALDLQLPSTEVRGEVRVRARVTDARSLVGLRTELSWDPELFELKDDSVNATHAQAALVHEDVAGTLRVDLALLGTTADGNTELFAFTLVPLVTPANIAVGSATEFASATTGEFRFEFAEVALAGGAFERLETAEEPLDPEGPGEEEVPGEQEDQEEQDENGEPEAPGETPAPEAPVDEAPVDDSPAEGGQP